ncbi:MAG: type III-A CRISPR-associated protein Csm2 [Candidatus Hydrogenedentes bacterium]|nr:type III-A CRISPR-associated protein Csm2 [Candidatus Hydrogenedentota bacterium]
MNRGSQGGHYQDRPNDRGGGERPDHRAMTQYYDNGLLKREVFVQWPRTIAASLGDNRTSLRRLYDHVAALHFRIGMGEDPTVVLQTGLGKLHRFAQYQAGRRVIKDQTRDFIQAHCAAVGSDVEKFEGFYQLFQSVMAYLKR